MQYIQLGNGGGLDPLMTNSSFLIEVDKDVYLLFDCGFNVMEKLLKLQEEDNRFRVDLIKYVYVSHIHDDHVGNLETLMFYNYFTNNIVITFIAPNEEVYNYMQLKLQPKLLHSNRVVNNFKLASIMKLTDTVYKLPNTTNRAIKRLTETYHGDCQSNGLIIRLRKNTSTHYLVITGDTKASSLLEDEITEMCGGSNDIIIYHDLSTWDEPSKNVHACKSEIRREYTEEFQSKLIYYHTGSEDFIDTWQDF